MKRKTREALNLTAGHAASALHALIADGKLAARDVTTALKRRKQLIKGLKDRLAALESGAVPATARARKAVPRKAARNKPRLSAATRAKYRQQGHYLAAIRGLSKQNRARIKSIRTRAGAGAAIKAAGELARKLARKKETARSTRSKASTQKVAKKAAVARKQKRHTSTSTRPITVKANTTKGAKTAAMATEQKQRPRTDTEGSSNTAAPAPRAEGHGLPSVGNPEHEGRGPAARDWSQA